MNALRDQEVIRMATWVSAVEEACARIAPQWPLEGSIAVNPYWGWIDRDMPAAATALAALSGARLLMPRAHYRAEWRAGRLRFEHLEAAVRSGTGAVSAAQLRDLLLEDEVECEGRARPLPLITDVVDRQNEAAHTLPWREHIVHEIGQHCAAHFDTSQARWHPGAVGGLYAAWRARLPHDSKAPHEMGASAWRAAAESLPTSHDALFRMAAEGLGLADAALASYFTALLLSVNGWASACAYRRWRATLAGQDDDSLRELLAIRLAWELLLWSREVDEAGKSSWQTAWRAVTQGLGADPDPTQRLDWTLQRALEWSRQQTWCAALCPPPADLQGEAPGVASADGEGQRPEVQAVFCIDVRSEVFRRALEASHPRLQTLGFAGFFGLPIDYQPLGSARHRPQMPGLLAPAWHATETTSPASLAPALSERRRQRWDWQWRWREFRTAAASGFSFVESFGLAYAALLLRESWPWGSGGLRQGAPSSGQDVADDALLRLETASAPGAGPADAPTSAAIDLLQGILKAMGLTEGHARLVLLCGHGSQTANNPHAGGLHCGACGGQTGEVNARLLATLLQCPAHRQGLAKRGVLIPADTVFVAGLHNTTTEEVVLFDVHRLPESHAADLVRLRQGLTQAGALARAERAPSLGLGHLSASPDALLRSVRKRATDWSELRPEWGLVNNAALIVAPRARTAALDLQGRVFLHDYDSRRDTGFQILEQIMTAPMLVSHWINLCYYASRVDPSRYGSGNKLLHNVVGGMLGVFEGNGGDLKVGLPWQSVHDGERWRHEPLRLSVFIAAPRAAIEGVLARHVVVRQLVDGAWLHLFALESPDRCLERRVDGAWVEIPPFQPSKETKA